MIFIDELNNMKLYKRPFFLPLNNKNKRKGSAAILLTPNYESSRNLMNHKLMTGKYYNGYYLDKDISLLIKDDKSLVKESSLLLEKKAFKDRFNSAQSIKRSIILQSKKGIYKDNKVKRDLDQTTDPLQTNPEPDTLRKARRENPEDDDLKKIDVPTLDIQIPEPALGGGSGKVAESCFLFNNEEVEITESYIRNNDTVIFLNEDLISDTSIKKAIYSERLKNNRDVFTIYNQVKLDNPEIKYTYLTLDKYKSNNIYVDLFYYNEAYFKNSMYKGNKGFSIYDSLMSRLINDKKLIDAGYTNRYIIVPVTDWSTDTKSRPWMYKDEITPMTILYHNAEVNINEFKKKYKDNVFVFLSNNAYFKLDVNEFEPKHLPMFKRFLTSLKNNEYVEGGRNDNADSSKVITMKVIDKIETSKNIEIHNLTGTNNKDSGSKLANAANDKDEAKKISSKITSTKPKPVEVTGDTKSKTDKEELVDTINSIADKSDSVEDALKTMDNDDYLKNIIMNLDAEEDDTVKISAARAARFNKLNDELMKKELNGKTIDQILNADHNKELPVTSLDIDTVNEEWKDLHFINMSKTYDIDEDIVAMLYDLQNKSTPVYIRNITTSDNSTTEDWLTTYKVEMEDVNGKRFTIKFDIPIVKDNFMMLRGNRKTLSNQLFLMPIIKTEEDTVQIVSNYNKIFIRRFGTLPGKSYPDADRIIKSLNKQNYKDIRVITADNSKICSKYELPIDYIDLAGQFDSIEYTSDKIRYTIYFNQDKFRKEYADKIDDKKGFPYGVTSKGEILYYTDTHLTFSSMLLNILTDASPEFKEVANAQHSSSKYCYSKMSILSSEIPLIVVTGYTEGLKKVLDKSGITWDIVEKKQRNDVLYDYIKFNDGFIRYEMNYSSSLLMNGLKECPTESYSLGQMNDKSMWLDFLDLFGGRIKGDGLDNFADLMIDPITREVLEHYNLPTDYVTILLYANNLLVDNKFIKHTQMEGRRIRRDEIIAGYFYKALAESYKDYQIQLKHGRQTTMTMKQSIVIDKIMTDPTESDASMLNALIDAEYNYAVTTKGLSGMNSDRSYSLDKRTFDDSMLNVLGMSTGFAGNVGITRQATIDTNVEGTRGYVKVSNDPNKISTTKTYCFTEALVPFGTTRDDPFRTAMTFIQTSKHNVRVNHSSPMLITNGVN